MIDSLLYAILPPHLKRSLNLAYLEKSIFNRFVAHLEEELELRGLENYGEFSIAAMTALPLTDIQQNIENCKIICHYCKKPGHVIRDCRRKMEKEQEQRNDSSILNTKPSTSSLFAPCLHFQQRTHTPEKSWSGPISANRPKMFKQDHPADNRKEGQEQESSTLSGPISSLKNTLN